MTELFQNISQSVKDYATLIWNQARQLAPEEATKLLNIATNTFEQEGLEEEADFLRFYFNLQMEIMRQ